MSVSNACRRAEVIVMLISVYAVAISAFVSSWVNVLWKKSIYLFIYIYFQYCNYIIYVKHCLMIHLHKKLTHLPFSPSSDKKNIYMLWFPMPVCKENVLWNKTSRMIL